MEQRPPDASAVVPPPSDFSERLVDAFFRRWFLYLLPVVALGAVGVYSTRSITAEYESYARVSATNNPYLDEPSIRGTDISPYESPADGTARLINEQLRTDAFIDDLALRVGLRDEIEAGLITNLDIRSHVGASGAGQNTLQLSARWSDAETAFRLVDETFKAYTEYLADVAAADSLEAVKFWTEQADAAAADVAAAERALDDYVALLPSDPQSRSTEQLLALDRLNATLDRALEDQSKAQDAVDQAQLTATQAASNSGRDLSVIDAPQVPTAPQPVRRQQLTAIVMFTMLGLLIGAAALVLSTVSDRSVRTRAHLAQASGIAPVVTVPRIKELRRRKKSREAESRPAA